MPCQLTFLAKVEMNSVNALREEWLSKVRGHSHAQISCAGVGVMTAAAAQLVVSLSKGLHAVGGFVALSDVSPCLREDLLLLGLDNLLQEPPRHV